MSKHFFLTNKIFYIYWIELDIFPTPTNGIPTNYV